MADYKFTSLDLSSGVFRYSNEAYIPNDDGNRDWVEYLSYVDGGGMTDPYQDTEDTLNDMILEVDGKNRMENLKNFPYTKSGGDEQNYIADSDSILAVSVEASGMTQTDPIPVPNGQWKTADKAGDGITPIYVGYTCGEFADFKTAYYTRSSNNFGVKETHNNNLRSLYLSGATSQEIRDYDYSTGWY